MTEQVKPQIKNFLLYLLVLIVAIIAVIFIFSRETEKKQEEGNKEATVSAQSEKGKTLTIPPEMTIDPKKNYRAKLETTKGSLAIEFFTAETPVTVNNFIALSKEGFYNGVVFHRMVKGFMIQTGDPRGDGSGGPGYTFADEKVTRDYKRGIVAMANRGPDTNGSQFFIMHQDYNLPKNYVIFGAVIEGMETVDKIAEVPTVDNGQGEKSKPTETIKIEKITIFEK